MKQAKKLLATMCLVLVVALISSISYAKYVLDSSILAANLEIDRTRPVGTVNYSTQDMTTENVEVEIHLSEPICEVKGWTLSEDKLKMTKIYEQNSTEEISIIDLAGNENTVKVSVENIDREKPVINLINIENTNIEYPNYANQTHTITATIKITDSKINSDIDISKIDIEVGGQQNPHTKVLKNLKQSDTEITFDLVLTDLDGNGELMLKVPDGFVTDMAGNSMQGNVFSTEITIDNIKPQGAYSQEALQSGKIRAKITSSEEIIKLDNWNTTDNKIFTKDFPANVSYIIEIIDFAQNKSEVEVNVTGATYIILTYASHNSEVGWTYGLGNYDIAGKKAVKRNPKYKTEALAFRITGGVSKDFVKVRGFVYTYWNNLSDFGRCKNTGYKYKLKGAPESEGTSYYTMNSSDLSTIEGKRYIQLGGSGMNESGVNDYNGKNPTTEEAIGYAPNYKYPYGVSEIQLALADYSELSVVYQILVNGKGWLKSATNGELTTAGETLPMSAIRAAIIPNSEVDNLVSLWNKDVGTYNVD